MHEHHRDRLREKAVSDISLLNEYEMLELLLFGVVPRKNTNDIAHRLIDQFGSINAVLSAKPDMLMLIEGVGKTVAAHIAALNSVFRSVCEMRDEFPDSFVFTKISKALIDFFKPLGEEAMVVFLLDKNHKIISRRVFYGTNSYQVEIDLNEFSKMILINRPALVAVAHNHLSGNVSPSPRDDSATLKFATAAMLGGATLLDHIIVSKDKVYSYYYDHKIEGILEKAKRALSE